MASKYTHDVVATVGEYTDSRGEKKKRYQTVGKAFQDDQGRYSLKMDAVPVGPEWSGWLSLYPRKDDRDQNQGGQRQAAPLPQRPAPTQAPRQPDDDAEDHVPF